MSQLNSMSFEKEVYKKYYALVYSTCRRTLTEWSLLEDAIQSTFLLYIKEEHKIKSDLASWFYWSAKNVSIVINRDLFKQKQVKENIKKEKSDNEAIEFSLDQLIDSLPQNKKELLLLKFYEGKTYLEIAHLFQSNENTIRSRINSIVELLRSKLKQKEVNLSLILVALFNPENNPPLRIDPHNSTFILQNSVYQQSILKGVYKMYFFAKLKIASFIILIIVFGLGTYLQLRSETEKAQKEEIVKDITKVEVAPQAEMVKQLEDVLLAFKIKWNDKDNDGLLDLFHPESKLKKIYLVDQDKKEGLKTDFTNAENAFGNIRTQEIFLVHNNRYYIKTEYSTKGIVYGTFEFQKASEKWLIFRFNIDEGEKPFNRILNLQTITVNGINGDFEQLKELKAMLNSCIAKLKANDIDGFLACFYSENKFLKQISSNIKEKEKLKKEWGEVSLTWGEIKERIIGYDPKNKNFIIQLEFSKAGSYLLAIKLIKVNNNWLIEELDGGN